MPTELPLNALEMALWVRDRAGQNVTGLIQHSDAGAQYTATRYAERLADVGAIASIGTVGDSFDNALAETVVGLYKTECVKIDGQPISMPSPASTETVRPRAAPTSCRRRVSPGHFRAATVQFSSAVDTSYHELSTEQAAVAPPASTAH